MPAPEHGKCQWSACGFNAKSQRRRATWQRMQTERATRRPLKWLGWLSAYALPAHIQVWGSTRFVVLSEQLPVPDESFPVTKATVNPAPVSG